MRVLVGCEFSGIVRDAFLERGHDAWSCDLLPTERPGPHIQGDVFGVLNQGWDLMIYHWPCTYLTRAQAGWFFNTPKAPKSDVLYGRARYEAMLQSAASFLKLFLAPIPLICGENPKPYRDARLIMGSPTQEIQPFQFGHAERKATCLWLKGLPLLVPTSVVDLPTEASKAQRLHRLSPSPDRWKERSRTYEGVAKAMAEQWG